MALAAATSAGTGLASAAGAFSPGMPGMPDYGRMSRDAQEAELELLPRRVEARQRYDPVIAALQNIISEQSFFGAPAGQREESYTDYEKRTRRVPVNYGPQDEAYYRSYGVYPMHAGPVGYTTEEYTVPVTKTRMVDVPATPGLIDLAERAQPRLSALQRVEREQALADVEGLGPRAMGAMRGYDPTLTGLLDRLGADAEEDLEAGYSLGPGLKREVEQAVRRAQADRGLGYGTTDVFTEAMNIGQAAEARRRERQQFASGVAGQRATVYGDPFVQVLGRSSGRTASPQGFLVPESSMVSPRVDGNAFNVGLAGYEAQQNAARAGYNAQMGGIGMLSGGLWNLAMLYGGQRTPSYSGWNTWQGALPGMGQV
jgi:hypothetical protein